MRRGRIPSPRPHFNLTNLNDKSLIFYQFWEREIRQREPSKHPNSLLLQNYKFAFKVSSIFLGTHGSEKEKDNKKEKRRKTDFIRMQAQQAWLWNLHS
jgi:hypothetical protein